MCQHLPCCHACNRAGLHAQALMAARTCRSHGTQPGAPPRPNEACLPGRAGRRGPGLVCALAFSVLWPGAGTAGELDWGDVATPLRIVNLNPFQLLYGVLNRTGFAGGSNS